MNEQDGLHPRVVQALEPDENIHVVARALNATLAVTDRRLLVAADERLALSVPLDNVRRVQFDIERARPATLVVVPEMPQDEPQVLAIPPEDYESAASALVVIGQRLAALS
jgi:hypothetical protein